MLVGIMRKSLAKEIFERQSGDKNLQTEEKVSAKADWNKLSRKQMNERTEWTELSLEVT